MGETQLLSMVSGFEYLPQGEESFVVYDRSLSSKIAPDPV